MKKEIFSLRDSEGVPAPIEQTEPLIIWTICLGFDVLAMPELNFLIISFYFKN
jgi:hypothetical protein